MKRQTFALLFGILVFSSVVVFAKLSASRLRGGDSGGDLTMNGYALNENTLSGPYTNENLTVFLIHGPDIHRGKPLLTLSEAMERKLVVVHETKQVNELAIENLSKDEDVFVQSGDIVKGGQQDRVISTDMIISSLSGRVPIDAFCVEQGRWTRRGDEPVAAFSASTRTVATRELKMAAKQARSQGKVWEEVAKAQEKMKVSVNANVQSPVSASSYQLSLENEKVHERSAEYVKALASAIDAKPAAIGYVFAVNGKLSSADIYSSSALFKKLWPRLLNASAVEAVGELPSYDKKSVASVDNVRQFLADAERGKESKREVTKRTHVVQREGERGVFFETVDMVNGASWVHKSYLAK